MPFPPLDQLAAGIVVLTAAIQAGWWLWHWIVRWRARPRPEKELGFNDLIQLGIAQFAAANTVMERMTKRIQGYSQTIGRQTQHLQNAKVPGSMWRARWAMRRGALATNAYARRLRRDLPQYQNAYRSALRTTIRVADVSRDFSTGGDRSIRELIGAMRAMEDSVSTSLQVSIGFRERLAGMPRLTTAMAKARLRAVEVLDEVIQERRAALLLTQETRRTLEDMQRNSG